MVDHSLLENSNRVNRLEKQLESSVIEIVANDITKRMKKYEQVTQDFAKFFNHEFLSSILEAKVDVTQMEKISQQKISRKEFESFVNVQELLDRKLNHISMIQVELTKSMIPLSTNTISQYNSMENANARLLQHEILHRQASLTYKWIQDCKIDSHGNFEQTAPPNMMGSTYQNIDLGHSMTGPREHSPDMVPSLAQAQTPYLNSRLQCQHRQTRQKAIRNRNQTSTQSIDFYETPKLANETERSMRAKKGVIRAKSLA